MSGFDPWLSIIGIGEDGVDALSPVAKTLIAQASMVIGGARHLALVDSIVSGETLAWSSPPQDIFPAILARRGQNVCVIATGDPFFYGIGSLLAQIVPPAEFLCLPAPSAFSLAANRLGWALQDCALVSVHGRALAGLVRHLQPRARLLVLAWDESTPEQIAALLVRQGLGRSQLVVCEAMGGRCERIRKVAARDFALTDIAALNMVAVEIVAPPEARIIPMTPGLPDEWFDHDGQITKRDIRAVTLASLAPRDGELLWDIGAGSGSVGIEWMLSGRHNRAIAIERDPVRAKRIANNAVSLGVPELSIIEGTAPTVLAGLPQPDAVFIGGGATAAGVIDSAWMALPIGGRLVANGVTIETQEDLIRRFRALGGALKTIQIAHADAVGGFHGMRPAMAVMQWSIHKP